MKVSENIRILSGRNSGKFTGKPGIIREKIFGDLVWTLMLFVSLKWIVFYFTKTFSFPSRNPGVNVMKNYILFCSQTVYVFKRFAFLLFFPKILMLENNN